MKVEEKIRLAVISGASHSLAFRKANKNSSAEDAINDVSQNMNKILKKFDETNSPNNIIALAVLTGASQAAKYAEKNYATEKEALKYVSQNMDEIVSKINKEE